MPSVDGVSPRRVQPNRSNDLTRFGDKGAEVKKLQEALKKAGAQIEADGDFGKDTKNALRDFQKKSGIGVDGIAGPETWAALAGQAPAKPATSTTSTTSTESKPTDSFQPVSAQGKQWANAIDSLKVTTNPKYQPGNGKTYCNVFAQDVTQKAGAPLPKNMTASQTADWLKTKGASQGWRQVSTKEATQMANQGKPTVLAWKNSDPNGHGHIAVVRPSDAADGKLHVAQAGSHNHDDTALRDGAKFGTGGRVGGSATCWTYDPTYKQ